MDKIQFGKRLAKLRLERELSQKWFAERAGIETRRLQDLEQGRREPTFKELIALVNALGCTFDFLMRDEKGAK